MIPTTLIWSATSTTAERGLMWPRWGMPLMSGGLVFCP